MAFYLDSNYEEGYIEEVIR